MVLAQGIRSRDDYFTAPRIGRGIRLNRRDRAEIWKAIEGKSKSLKWKLRAQVGERASWYELPEEVRSPYQPSE